MEEWKDIVIVRNGITYDYTGLYKVSNTGKIYSLVKNKIMKNKNTKAGYLVMGLTKNKKSETFYVHRIVASMFLENPHNYEQVNHKDEDKTNNNIENLEWCSSDYNANYGTRNEKVSESRKKYSHDKNPRAKKVICIETEQVFGCIKDAGEYYGINKQGINNCCKGKQLTAAGYHWMYYEEWLDNQEKGKMINE